MGSPISPNPIPSPMHPPGIFGSPRRTPDHPALSSRFHRLNPLGLVGVASPMSFLPPSPSMSNPLSPVPIIGIPQIEHDSLSPWSPPFECYRNSLIFTNP